MNLWTLKEHAELFNVRLPNSIWVSNLNVSNAIQLKEWVDKDSEKDGDIEYPEGYVVYWAGKPVAKVKNSKYMLVFRISGGNKKHSYNQIIESIFAGTFDDICVSNFINGFPELQKFADDIKQKVAGLGTEVMKVAGEIFKVKYSTQKDYALAVQTLCSNKQLHSFFYQNKEKLLSGANISEIYTVWIKECYKRFTDLWKCNEDPKDNRE